MSNGSSPQLAVYFTNRWTRVSASRPPCASRGRWSVRVRDPRSRRTPRPLGHAGQATTANLLRDRLRADVEERGDLRRPVRRTWPRPHGPSPVRRVAPGSVLELVLLRDALAVAWR